MMRKRLCAPALLAVALAPSACFAWRWRAMPHLGLHQDDALYLVSSQSLADGHGYRIASLPGTPFQTKYPPVLPILLAPLWMWGPAFPEILKSVMLLAWAMLPPCLLLMRAVFRQFGLGAREAWLLTFAAALHPILGLLSTSVMSDLLFLTLFLGALLWAEKALDSGQRTWMALAAGLLAGAAFLTRTAALPLLLTGPICFLCRGRRHQAYAFFAGMFPAVAGWFVWTASHRLITNDPALLYYTSYFAMQTATVRLDNLIPVLWYNADALLRSFGKLLLFDVALVENVHLERILGVAAIVGAVRLVKRSGRLQYPVAAAALICLLLGYFFTSDERVSLPLYPLVLMGFWTEVKHFCTALQVSWKQQRFSERAAAFAGAVALAALGVSVAASYALGYALFLPKLYSACQRDLTANQAAYTWIRTRTPPEATLNAYDDPVAYLHTKRRALGMPMPSARVYTGEAEKAAERFILGVPRRAQEQGADYLLVMASDFYREGRAGMLSRITAQDPSLQKVFAAGSAVVYRVGAPFQAIAALAGGPCQNTPPGQGRPHTTLRYSH